MNISVILAHPYAQSFNAAIAAVVVKTLNEFDHAVRFHDLYREHFDPVIPEDELVGDQSRDPLVRLHQEEIRTADGIVIIHPNWWGQPPAVLKGWVDRVLRENVAYAFPVGDSCVRKERLSSTPPTQLPRGKTTYSAILCSVSGETASLASAA